MTGNPFKRTAIVASLALVAMLATVVAPGFASAQDEFVSGSGKAKAQILRIGPSSAQLSLAPSVGVALADHLGVVGRGESLVADYAALDGNVQDDVPSGSDGNLDPKGKQLPPLRVESTQEGSAAGKTQRALPTVVQRARADVRPYGYSQAELEDVSVPGLLQVSKAQAESWSGVIKIDTEEGKKTVREAGGTVDIASFSIGSDTLGQITLKKLHWEATQRTDENDDQTPELSGSFTFGSMRILDPSGEVHEFAGPTAGDIPAQMRDGLAQFATATGLHIRMPELLTAGGVTRLTPLGFSIIESPVGKQVGGPVQSGLQPLRDGVTDEFLKRCSEGAGEEDAGNCGLPLLVADLLIGPVAGGGRLDIELGGVSGFTEGQVFDGFDFNFGGFDGGFDTPVDLGDINVPAEVAPVVAGEQVVNDTPAFTEQPGVVDSGGPTQVAAPQTFQLTGSRASAAWAVGLVGLGAALAMAATDYRRLRTRRRLITPIS